MNSACSIRHLISHGGYWLLLYAALWLLLSGAKGLSFGLAFAVAATALSLWLKLPPFGLRLIHLPRFLLFFFYETVLGAWDVARRALHPNLPLAPAWVIYPLHCPNPRVRLLLSAMVGLMPGTLASEVAGENLYLHVLDERQDWLTTVTRMETYLARLLGEVRP